MPKSSAGRSREYRKRMKKGKSVFRIEANKYEVSDALVEAGFLPAWDADDKQKIEAALSKAASDLTRIVTRHGS